MSLYFFDITDGAGTMIDEEGMDFPDIEGAHREAMLSLGEMAREETSGPNYSGALSIHVRDGREVLFTVSMEYRTVFKSAH